MLRRSKSPSPHLLPLRPGSPSHHRMIRTQPETSTTTDRATPTTHLTQATGPLIRRSGATRQQQPRNHRHRNQQHLVTLLAKQHNKALRSRQHLLETLASVHPHQSGRFATISEIGLTCPNQPVPASPKELAPEYPSRNSSPNRISTVPTCKIAT